MTLSGSEKGALEDSVYRGEKEREKGGETERM